MRAIVGFLVGVLTFLNAAGVEASRLYPFVGVAWRQEYHVDRHPDAQALARAGVACSLGRLALTPTVSANTGHFELGVEMRYRIGGPQ